MKTRSITIALLCMLAFAFSHVLAQSPNLTEIIIGEGTETSCQLPFNACHEEWRYTLYSEYIIPASEMGEPSVINSIAFEIDNADMMYYCELYIWLGTTEDEIHTSETDWLDPDLMTQVYYSPDISLGWEEGWTTSTFELNEHFVYRGGNLVVGVGVVFWQDESILATQCTSTTHQSLWTYNRLDPWGYWGGGEKNMNNDRDEGTLSPLRPNIKLVVNTNALPVCIPEVLDLGYRPSGCWTAPLEAQLVNNAFEGSIVSAEIDNSFFSLNGLELPYDFDAIDTIPYAISCGIGSGTQTGTLTFTFDNDNTLEVPLNATAYSAQTPDVWELAREVNTFPYTETFLSGASVFDNYQLPSPFEDGNDVVFKLDFGSDMLLDASVEGNNGKVVLYREGFEGLGGPCNNNTFILGDDAAYSYSCDFESGFCNDFNWINDSTYPWTVTNNDAHGGMQCIKSTSLPDDTSLTSILQINLNAPEDGRISFYAKVSSHYRYGGTGSFFIDEETKIDHIRGTEWDYYSFEITQGLHVLSWVYNGGFWTNGDNCFYVDDLNYISEENNFINVIIPNGTYYLAASSTSDEFTVTIDTESAPYPIAANTPTPGNNANFCNNNFMNDNPESLSWIFGDFTTEYQVLFGESNPPTTILVDWTYELTNNCPIEVSDNKTYYWCVNSRNTSGTTEGEIWSFSTYKNHGSLTDFVFGNGNVSSPEIPIHVLGGNSYVESIYPADAIGESCVIYSISYDVSRAYPDYPGSHYFTMRIYMDTTSKASHTSSTDWHIFDENNLVFEQGSSFYNDTPGWMTFFLDKPFHYEGNNLVIGLFVYGRYLNTDTPMTINNTISEGGSIQLLEDYKLPDASTQGTVFDLLPNIRFGVLRESLVCESEMINLGYHPNNSWIEPYEAKLINEGIPCNITSCSHNNNYYSVGGIELPYQCTALDTINFTISTGVGEGIESDVISFSYGTDKTLLIPVYTTCYTPVEPDVWELARVVNTFPFSETFTNNMEVYGNYQLPEAIEDGKDVVYKLEFNSDVFLSVSVTEGDGNNYALYREDFDGRGGPMRDNAICTTLSETFVPNGVYYLVVSSTNEEFTVNIGAENVPVPVMVQMLFPNNLSNWYGDSIVPLRWNNGEYTSELQLLFGDTYPPTEVLVAWTNDLIETYDVETEDAMTYYWRVNERNSAGTTEGPIWSFTTFKGITPSVDNIIYVTPTGAGVKNGSSWENAASNLQAAIDAAAAYEENQPQIWVAKGTYLANGTYEEIDGQACVFRSYNNVVLYGSLNGDEPAEFDMNQRNFETNATILDAESVCYVVGSEGATWDGFEILHGGEGGIRLNPNNVSTIVIRNCKVLYSHGNGINITHGDLLLYNSQVSYHEDNGIYMDFNYWNNLVEKCIVSNNTNNGIDGCGRVINSFVINNGNGIVRHSNAEAIINGCIIANNNGQGTNFTIVNASTIVNNGVGIGRMWSAPISMRITNSIIWGNEVQFPYENDPYYWSPFDEIVITNNAIQGGVIDKNGVYPCINLSASGELNGIQPGFVNPTEGIGRNYTGGDWSLLPNSPCINMGATSTDLDIEYDIAGNPRVQQGRIDIGAFESPYEKPNIQYAIRPDNHNIIYVKENGTGDGSSWDNASNDLYQAMETAILYEPAATLWVAEGNYPTANYSFLVKQDLKMYGGFEGNEPADYDLSQRDFTAHPSVLDGREAMRILHQSDTLSTTNAAMIDGFTLRNGIADIGAGAYLLKNTTLSHCTVENNTTNGGEGKGGGIYADGAILRDSFVRNNTASQGGGIYAINSTLCQTLISNNEAETGGGIYAQNTEVLQSNILKNQGDGLCVFADSYNDFVHLNNTILWGNEGKNVQYMSNIAQANTIINHCAIEGLQNADNDNVPLSADNEGASGPWFVAPVAETGVTEEIGDWQLQEASVCIDGGSNNYGAVNYDLNGSSRIQNGRMDIGVYESPYEAQCVNIDIREVSIREGETYAFYGSVLSELGIYEHRWTEGGCDSLVMLHLHVADIVFVSEDGAGLKDGSSWDNALDGNTVLASGYTRLADALMNAPSGTHFWITGGTYIPCGDGDVSKNFLLKEGSCIFGRFEGTESQPSDRHSENAMTLFTGMLQNDTIKENNTQTIFTTQEATSFWQRPALLDQITIKEGYTANHRGAALKVSEKTKAILNQCTLSDNYEGAIYNEGYLNLTSSVFLANINQTNGDDMGVEPNIGILPDYSYFITANAGVLCNMNGYTVIKDCQFLSNHSNNKGCIYNTGMIHMDGCLFENNTANEYAGCILSSGKMRICNTVFDNNRCDLKVGVMIILDSLEMINCTLSNNNSNYYAATNFPPEGTASNFGGYRTSGIDAYGYSLVKSCSFINNSSTTCPGGAFSVRGKADIIECEFIGNKGVAPWEDPDYEPEGGGSGLHVVIVSGSPDGPALYVGGSANVTDCLFNDNYGYVGNTIGVDGHLTMNRCIITESHSLFFSQGAIKVTASGSLIVENSLFANNDASVIQQVEGVHTKLINTTIPNNSGDVIRFQSIYENSNPSWVDLDNCIISGYPSLYTIDSIGISNAIYGIEGIVTSNTTLFNSEFGNLGGSKGLSETKAREIVIVSSLNNLPVDEVLVDSIVTKISEGRFEGVFISGNTRIEYQSSLSNSMCMKNAKPRVSNRDGDTNLYDVDPMFINPTTVLGIDENLSALDADWRLQAGSPCINAGDATLIDLDSLSLDLGGEMRVKNCEIDMGAYEYGEMVWDTITDSLCEGEPYADNGFDLPAMDPGDYVFQRTGDCEDNTLYTLLLHVNPKTYHSICQVVTEPYELNGITYSESGTYVQTLPNQYGCDSIITLHLVVTPIYVQTTELFQGWTWWAPTVETNVADIEAALGNNLESIQSQSGSASGNTILGQMYRIKTREDCTLTLSGTRTSNAVTITLLPGYNWFGYTGTQPSAIENLNITPAEGDKVISQEEGFAIFNGTEWEGTLDTLIPGKGYVYVSNAATPKTLVIGE